MNLYSFVEKTGEIEGDLYAHTEFQCLTCGEPFTLQQAGHYFNGEPWEVTFERQVMNHLRLHKLMDDEIITAEE